MRPAKRLLTCSLACVLAVGAVIVAGACAKTTSTCFAGDYQGCACPDGGWGYAACDPQLEGFGACVCNGSTPGIDAASAPEAGGRGSGGGRDAGADQ